MEELKSAINELLNCSFYKTAIATVTDRKDESYDLVLSLLQDYKEGVQSQSKQFDFEYVFNLAKLSSLLEIEDAFSSFSVVLEHSFSDVFKADNKQIDRSRAYAEILWWLTPRREDFNEEPEQISALRHILFSPDSIDEGRLVAFYVVSSFLQSFPEKYLNKAISTDDFDKALCEFYIKVLNLFTIEFDEHQTAMFLPVLNAIIEKILDHRFESRNLESKAYNTIVDLIVSSSFGFNYSGFNLYYRWIKQLDAEQYGTVIKAERFIRRWRDLAQEDIYSFDTLEEIGRYLFDRVKTEVVADDKCVKIALKRTNYYPLNNRNVPYTDDGYALELCGYLEIIEPPKRNYDQAIELCRKIKKRYKEIANKIDCLIDETKKLQEEAENRSKKIIDKSLNNKVAYNVLVDKEMLVKEFFELKQFQTLWKEETTKDANGEYIQRKSGILVYLKDVLKENMKQFLDSDAKEQEDIVGEENQDVAVSSAEGDNISERVLNLVKKWALDCARKKPGDQDETIDDRFDIFFNNLSTFDKLLNHAPGEIIRIIGYRIKFMPFYEKIRNRYWMEHSEQLMTQRSFWQREYSKEVGVHPLNHFKLLKICDSNMYLRILDSVCEELINDLLDTINKPAFTNRRRVLKGAIDSFRNGDYEVTINLLPVQIEGLFADFIEFSSLYKFQNDLEKYVKSLNLQLVPKIQSLDGLDFDYVAYFKYYFNSIMRNTIAHGNYIQYIKSRGSGDLASKDVSIKILAIELMLDLNTLLHIMTDNTEIDTARMYIAMTADSLTESDDEKDSDEIEISNEELLKRKQDFLDLKYRRLFLDLIGESRLNPNYLKGSIFVSYEPKQVLFWIFNAEMEQYFDAEKLKVVRKELCSGEFWEYVLSKLRNSHKYDDKSMKVFSGIVTMMFEIVKSYNSSGNGEVILELLGKVNKEMQSILG